MTKISVNYEQIARLWLITITYLIYTNNIQPTYNQNTMLE